MKYQGVLTTAICIFLIFSCADKSGDVDNDNSQLKINRAISKDEIKNEVENLEENSQSSIKEASELNVTDLDSIPDKLPRKKYSSAMTFDELVFHFDTIKAGDVIEHNFTFTNTGNLDLVINKTKVTCGCTVPSYPFIPIQPGEGGKIGVRYSSVGKTGDQEAKVTILTNGKPGQYIIKMKGYVKEGS